MKILNLNLDIKDVNLSPEDINKSNQEVMITVLKNVCVAWSGQKKGMKEDDRRVYYKLCDDLEKAVNEKKKEVNLEDRRIDFLCKCFKEGIFTPNTLLQRVEELVWQVKDLNSKKTDNVNT